MHVNLMYLFTEAFFNAKLISLTTCFGRIIAKLSVGIADRKDSIMIFTGRNITIGF